MFGALVAEAVPTVCQLLGSKSNSDVLEAIHFFVTGFEFGLVSAMQGLFYRSIDYTIFLESVSRNFATDAERALNFNPHHIIYCERCRES